MCDEYDVFPASLLDVKGSKLLLLLWLLGTLFIIGRDVVALLDCKDVVVDLLMLILFDEDIIVSLIDEVVDDDNNNEDDDEDTALC